WRRRCPCWSRTNHATRARRWSVPPPPWRTRRGWSPPSRPSRVAADGGHRHRFAASYGSRVV
ncbi:MAG: hypothetical protein AVDCRST_MAG04-162, partial [uncultured Acetobacteraceae bacterium]